MRRAGFARPPEKTCSSTSRMSLSTPCDDQLVVVHDLVEDGVEDGRGPCRSRSGRSSRRSRTGAGRGLAVADRDDEVRVDEELDLVDLDELDSST